MSVLDAEGKVDDKELNELCLEVQARLNHLFNSKTEWTLEDKIVAVYHLQGYTNSEIMRRIMENIMKKQGGPGAPPGLRLAAPEKK
jgi:hypothetical protein